MGKKQKKLRIAKKNTPFINQSEDSILIQGGIISINLYILMFMYQHANI